MLFDGVWFRYARRAPWALHDARATVSPGETVVVLGPNGAGKSTLLQLAAGVLLPSRGAIRDRPPIVGWVPERFPADQPFTLRGYLHAMAALRGVTPATADHWIERLGLAAHTGTGLGALSKGTAQKVGLAQALLVPPGLLVLDEPWEGLDAQARTLIPEIVAEVTGAGGAVLVSDHRGEITGLPGAIHWSVAAATLHVAGTVAAQVTPAPPRSSTADKEMVRAGADEVVVEIAVPRAEADATVVRLRDSGHHVLRVRDHAAPARPEREAR
ncbi:ABC transporter ATP-binding protein [Actinoplanes cyaneus]|uniref:ABC transporter ATP-binding protein n=1 Tax=Actinoplanes cyaneus TaxID=52696 RepID=A0A919IF06_9ACTN|nr:ATP-binding cassette domain-containing protein [Actinoplanes cyaneus]MCW2136843.1 ABC transporter [Actinoplanes cyaneus]GID64006.1 ABC transporter ATP-binding protein [Actinoplanes cyaneus]